MTIDSGSTPITIANLHSATASGTGEVGASITLVATDGTNFSAEFTTTVGEDGTWTIEGMDASNLADGTITVTVTATDAAGNTNEVTAETTKTTVAITSVTDPVNSDNEADVNVSGTGEVGAGISARRQRRR